MGWEHEVAEGIFNVDLFKDWFTWHNQVVLWVLLAYAFVASWSDVTERRIPNVYTVAALVVVIGLQAMDHNLASSSVAVGILLVALLPPTLSGLWGQGDWKMSAVYGAALGVVPSLVVWFFGYLLIPRLRPILRRIGANRLTVEETQSIPLAAPIMLAMVVAYVLVTIMTYMGW